MCFFSRMCIYSLIWRWLDRGFQGHYLPSLSINHVAINKDLEKSPEKPYWAILKGWRNED